MFHALPIPATNSILRVETSPSGIHDGTYQIAGNIQCTHITLAHQRKKREKIDIAWRDVSRAIEFRLLRAALCAKGFQMSLEGVFMGAAFRESLKSGTLVAPRIAEQ